MNKGKETLGKFVVASSDSATTLELLKETFHKMAFLVLLFVKRNNDFVIATGLSASDSSLPSNLISEFVTIISAISHNYIGF